MKIITDLNEANALLKLYSGSSMKIYSYNISLKRMMLKLMPPNFIEIIYLVGIGCESIKGRFNYTSAHLSISSEEKKNNDVVTKICDTDSGFELITSGGFSLAQGGEAEFGDSFENFFRNGNQ